MNRLKKTLRILLPVIASLQLTACSKTVQWEEEVPLNTGEVIWVKRTVKYTYQGGAGNPFDMAYRPEWDGKLEFMWRGKKYAYQGEAQVFVIAISPRQQPVLVAEPDDGIWRGKHDFRSCTRPTYVQLIPDATGQAWSWPPAIEPWLYGLSANLMRHRGPPEEMKKKYTRKERTEADAIGWIQFPPMARIDPTYSSTGYCKGRN